MTTFSLLGWFAAVVFYGLLQWERGYRKATRDAKKAGEEIERDNVVELNRWRQ